MLSKNRFPTLRSQYCCTLWMNTVCLCVLCGDVNRSNKAQYPARESEKEEGKINCKIQVIMKAFRLSSIVNRKWLRGKFNMLPFGAVMNSLNEWKDIQTLIKCQSNVQYHDKSRWFSPSRLSLLLHFTLFPPHSMFIQVSKVKSEKVNYFFFRSPKKDFSLSNY
jgi:hypothetical protein